MTPKPVLPKSLLIATAAYVPAWAGALCAWVWLRDWPVWPAALILSAAAVFADQGNLVTVLEKDPARTALLATGIAPFREPGLDSLLAKGISGERLRVASDIGAAIEGFDGGSPLLAFVAVGTPPDQIGRAHV